MARAAGVVDTEAPWRRRARPLLGTRVEVAARLADADRFRSASDAAFAEVAACHAAMSFHEPDSDLATIAAAEAGNVVGVSGATWQVLRIALAIEAESDGVFNVAVAPRLVADGLLPRPRGRTSDAALARSALAALELLTNDRVRIVRPVWIDLGGIAKGAAVDAALAALVRHGAVDACVDAGGDLAVAGDADHAVHVRGLSRDGVLHPAGRLGDGAIATSAPAPGAAARALVTGGRVAVWGDRSVSVLAPTCVVADALTKVVAVLGPASAVLLSSHGARAFSLDRDGRIEHVG